MSDSIARVCANLEGFVLDGFRVVGPSAGGLELAGHHAGRLEGFLNLCDALLFSLHAQTRHGGFEIT